ncbi:MAG: hypothetical protein RIM80_07540 [Alphaproteobacteria bacterium]
MPTSRAATASDATASAADRASGRKPFGTGGLAARIRLVSGLILFSFVTTHYLNHALGLISFETMEAGRLWFIAFWRLPPVEILLAAALVAHVSAALLKAARSNTFKMRPLEWAQLGFGLLLPFLLAEHVLATRGLSLHDGMTDNYAWTLLGMWPGKAVQQSFALFAVWVHGCIGLHFWLRLKAWYEPAAPWLLGLAVLWPTLAFLGFVDGGQHVAALAQDREWVQDLLIDNGFAGRDAAQCFEHLGRDTAIGAGAVILAAASWRT